MSRHGVSAGGMHASGQRTPLCVPVRWSVDFRGVFLECFIVC